MEKRLILAGAIAFWSMWLGTCLGQSIQSFVPASACPGTQITVVTTGFPSEPAVQILGGTNVTVPANAVSFSGNNTLGIVQFTLPNNATTGAIRLTQGSNADTSSSNLTVFSVPTSDAGTNKTVCPGATTTLGTTSVNSITYQWTPATGLSDDNDPTPDFSLSTPGTYTYSLVATNNNGCSSAPDNVNVTVSSPPSGVGISGDSVVCSGEVVVYQQTGGQSGFTYAWSVVGGSPTTGTGSTLSVTWNNPPGPKQVRVIPSSSQGCAGTQVVKAISLQSPPNVSITSPVIAAYAAADTSLVQLVGSPAGGSFSVLTTNPAAPAGLLSGNTIDLGVANATGTFQIQYSYLDPLTGCAGKDTLFLQIYDPGGAVCGLPASICLTAGASPILLNKDTNCGISSIFPGATVTDMIIYGPGVIPISAGVYQFDPNATGGPGPVVISAIYYQFAPFFNVFTASQLVNIYEPLAPIAFDPLPVCQGTPIPTLSAFGSPSGNYIWSSSPTLSSPVVASTFTPSSVNNGINTYYVAYTDPTANGCRSLIDSVQIVVTSAPNSPTVPASQITACPGTLLPPLVADPGASLRWYNSDPTQGPALVIGFGTQVQPTISAPGASQTYFVTDVIGTCESLPVSVSYRINPLLNPTFSGLDSLYCNPPPSNPVVLTGSATGQVGPGIFSGSGVVSGQNLWDVEVAGNGTHVIQYLAEDNNGCKDSVQQLVVVIPQPQVTFTGLDSTYCQLAGQQVTLQGVVLPGVQSAIFRADSVRNGFTLVPNTDITAGLATFSPENAPLGLNTLTYFYQDQNGCADTISQTTRVYPQPRALFKTAGACQDSVIRFLDLTTFVGNVPGTVSSWLWRFGDGDTSVLASPDHVYSLAGAYNLTLEVATDSGCTDQLRRNILVESNPVVDFSWKNICLGDATFFRDSTFQDVGNLRSWQWDFKDLVTSSLQNPRHLFLNPGIYKVTLSAASDSGCTATDTQRVFILDQVNLTGPGDPTYFEGFENGTGGWVPDGTIAALENWSWELGTPASSQTINRAGQGQKSWKTRLDGPYPANEQSFLNSPCFDLSGLTRPMIALKTWTHTNPQNDGAVFQYSLNNGDSWLTLGEPGSGIGWYTQDNVLSTPGTSLSNPFRYGWASDTQTDWQDSRHKLDLIQPATQVRFRVGFSSLNVVDSLKSGFALDSVWIGNRKKNLLLEYFAHTGDIGSYNTASNYLYTLADSNTLDLSLIQYHIDNPGGDYWHDLLPEPANARALYYKIPATTYHAVLDGNRANLFATFLKQLPLDLRMLETPAFDITPPAMVLGASNRLDSVRVTMTSKEAFNEELIVQVALISKQFDPAFNPNNSPFRFQLVNMFPGPEGTRVPSWPQGQTRTFSLKATTPTHNVQFDDDFVVVAFVQNLRTGEIFQTAQSDVPTGAYVTRLEESLPEYLREVLIFPNPAFDKFACVLSAAPKQELSWKMINLLGVEVQGGKLLPGQTKLEVDTRNLASGMYQFELTGKDETGKVIRKIAVTH